MTEISSYLRQHSKNNQSRPGNVLVQSMRDNIQELNRSMGSIEKMIAQSRKIIMDSRQNSLNKTMSIQNKSESPYKNVVIGVSPRVEPPTIKKKSHPPHAPTIIYSESNPASRIKGVASSKTFAYTSKFNKTAQEHQLNLVKFQPQTVKKQMQLRRSRASEKQLQDSRNNNESNVNVSEATPTKKQFTQNRLQNTPVAEIFQKEVANNNQVYKFSPQRTSKQRQKPRLQPKQISLKIKLKPTPRNTGSKVERQRKPYIKLETSKQPDMIKIEDDDYDSDPPYCPPYEQQESQNKKVRFKTEYKQQQEDQHSIIKKFRFGSPPKNMQESKTSTNKKGKINLRLFDSNPSHRQPPTQSYRDQKASGVEVVIETPRENRKLLVQELQRLETASSTEEERRAKFILKIRKYGFVEKYLNESEIWSVYDYLVGSQIPQLKWPIFIVDEVYKKMKSSK